MQAIFSVLTWLYYSICILVFFALIAVTYLLTVPFDRFNRLPNRLVRGLGLIMIRAFPGWELELRGIENYGGEKSTIFVSNHQSFLDMPMVYCLPWTMKWVSKKSLFRIPILGWIIFMTGHLGIDRQSLRSVKILDRLVKPIQAGIPAMIFPEGTRSEDGTVGRFKNGAFRMARRYNFQIQPLVLNGGQLALPSGSWKFSFGQKMVVSVLEPVDPQQFSSTEELRNHVREEIVRELDSIKSETDTP